jgi:hypothetical protein
MNWIGSLRHRAGQPRWPCCERTGFTCEGEYSCMVLGARLHLPVVFRGRSCTLCLHASPDAHRADMGSLAPGSRAGIRRARTAWRRRLTRARMAACCGMEPFRAHSGCHAGQRVHAPAGARISRCSLLGAGGSPALAGRSVGGDCLGGKAKSGLLIRPADFFRHLNDSLAPRERVRVRLSPLARWRERVRVRVVLDQPG